MVESLFTLVAGLFSAALYCYWMFWAYVLIVKDVDAVGVALDCEYSRITLLTRPSKFGARLFQGMDHHALAIWYRVNRPVWRGLGWDTREDVISMLGRFGFAVGEGVRWSRTGY